MISLEPPTPERFFFSPIVILLLLQDRKKKKTTQYARDKHKKMLRELSALNIKFILNSALFYSFLCFDKFADIVLPLIF